MFAFVRRTLRLGALLTAAAACCAAMPAFSAAAASEERLTGYYGDLNGDLNIDRTDVAMMQQYLLNAAPLSEDETQAAYADLDHDGRINGSDFTLLKRIALHLAAPEGIYEPAEEPKLIDPPIAAVNPSMPSVGTVHILMISVDFPDFTHSEGLSTEQIAEIAFGEADEHSNAYPFESVTAYYERASYGRLHLTGDVYHYNAQYPLDTYVKRNNLLVNEVLSAFDSDIDYRYYDVNGNNVIDTMLFALPDTAVGRDSNSDGQKDWWPYSTKYSGTTTFDGVKPGNICVGAWSLNDRSGFNSTWIHELGHAMGLPDYYKYENNETDYYGLNGKAGYEMMDDAYADMSAFSKLMYGWYTENEIQIYTGGTMTFTLESNQHTPSCILIPRNALNYDGFHGFHDEYFIIELNTPDLNNHAMYYQGKAYRLFYTPGVRVLHCNAEIVFGLRGMELKWNNYGLFYDNSNQKQRVLRLVNDNGSYFGSGDVINDQIPDFRWYDAEGDLTVNPQLTIRIDNLRKEGICTVTISPDN